MPTATMATKLIKISANVSLNLNDFKLELPNEALGWKIATQNVATTLKLTAKNAPTLNGHQPHPAAPLHGPETYKPNHAKLYELLNTLDQLGTADAIAKYFYDNGVRGTRDYGGGCPIQKWLGIETGEKYWIGRRIASHEDDCDLSIPLPAAATEFIEKFDGGNYPEIAIGVRTGLHGAVCPCFRCLSIKQPAATPA